MFNIMLSTCGFNSQFQFMLQKHFKMVCLQMYRSFQKYRVQQLTTITAVIILSFHYHWLFSGENSAYISNILK